MNDLQRLVSNGCGMVCIHYATGLGAQDVAEDGQHPLLDWIGGYFATRCKHHQSVARVFDLATIEPAAKTHPIHRGWKTFSFRDEPYIKNYFGPAGMGPAGRPDCDFASSSESPHRETVAWAIDRADGGRGVGVVMPHFFRNWENRDMRTLIMNSIAWSAKREIPDEGIATQLPDLATFEPDAVDACEQEEDLESV